MHWLPLWLLGVRQRGQVDASCTLHLVFKPESNLVGSKRNRAALASDSPSRSRWDPQDMSQLAVSTVGGPES